MSSPGYTLDPARHGLAGELIIFALIPVLDRFQSRRDLPFLALTPNLPRDERSESGAHHKYEADDSGSVADVLLMLQTVPPAVDILEMHGKNYWMR